MRLACPSGRRAFYLLTAVTTLAVAAAAPRALADITLAPPMSEGMVLQQKTPVRIYGAADPGEPVTVSIQGQNVRAKVGADGKWEAWLRPLTAGGPFRLMLQGKNRIVLNDVLVGEVWVASGQSNMEWPLAASANAPAEIAAANDPQLRMFTVPKRIASEPQPEVAGGKWDAATPQNAGRFSAVGYYFARALRAARGVPVGVIHTSWGGTRIEAWMSKPVLLAHGVSPNEFQAAAPNSPEFQRRKALYDKQLAAWKAAGSPEGPTADPGVSETARGWAAADLNAADWKTIPLPGAWENSSVDEFAYLDGGVWFRKEVTVPSEQAGKDLTLSLGAIDDFDTTYFNGVKVGGIGAETENSWQAPRRYTVPGSLVKAGKNVVAVRVWDNTGGGGLTGPESEMRLSAAGGSGVSLAGPWQYRIENGRVGNPGAPPSAMNPNAASGLYNAMLAPLARYTIRGGIWYQGESNAGQAMRYRALMPAMIENWRRDWGIRDFPFGIVQLAPFMAIKPEPSESNWAALREAQTLTITAIPNVFVAVITDVGDEKDIHPRRKQPVGERLALGARKVAYGENLVASGPTFKSLSVQDGKAVLQFDNVGAGLEARSTDSAGKPAPAGKVVGFAVAGADGKFVNAEATITGPNTLTVSAPQVAAPVAVRFGWADYPVVNLWNKDGLPAVPFRTDVPK